MTIEFNCPQCKAVIAFPDRHAGKRARCLTCKQHLIIPAASGQRPALAAPDPVDKGDPVPGFYKAAFVDGWRLFFTLDGLTGLVFVAAAVGFRFFVGHTDYSAPTPGFNILLPIGLIVTLASWGSLFCYYLDVITAATLEGDQLADVTLGDGVLGVVWSIVKGLWMFAFGLLLVEMPYLVWLGLQEWLGFRSTVVPRILTHVGLLVFPMVILTFGVNRDVAMLGRVDQMIRPMLRAFRPYLSVAVLFWVVWNLQMFTRDYGDLKDQGTGVVSLLLAAQLAVQVLAITAMRALGLFYKHHACYFAW
jgi:hypothetical protein